MIAVREPLTVGTGALEYFCDIDALNSLLRGELAAVEMYDRALSKFAGTAAAAELQVMRDDHNRAANALRDQVRHFGGFPAGGSGVWGAFATTVTRAARVIGSRTLLSALKQGEEHGANEYQEALENPELADECRLLIRTELLPSCTRHAASLTRMTGVLEAA